jgi:hypothetical protein
MTVAEEEALLARFRDMEEAALGRRRRRRRAFDRGFEAGARHAAESDRGAARGAPPGAAAPAFAAPRRYLHGFLPHVPRAFHSPRVDEEFHAGAAPEDESVTHRGSWAPRARFRDM